MKMFWLSLALLLSCGIQVFAAEKPKDMIVRGIKLYNADKFEEAEAAFNKAITTYPKNARAYAARGYFYGMVGQANASLRDLNTAISLDKKDPSTWCEMGIRYVNDSPPRHNDAIEAYSKAIELDPKFRMPYHYRALSYEKLGDKKSAAKDFKMADKIKTNVPNGCMPWFDGLNP